MALFEEEEEEEEVELSIDARERTINCRARIL